MLTGIPCFYPISVMLHAGKSEAQVGGLICLKRSKVSHLTGCICLDTQYIIRIVLLCLIGFLRTRDSPNLVICEGEHYFDIILLCFSQKPVQALPATASLSSLHKSGKVASRCSLGHVQHISHVCCSVTTHGEVNEEGNILYL